MFFIVFLNFVTYNGNIIPYGEAQVSMDSFSAAGTIVIRLVPPAQTDNQEIKYSQSVNNANVINSPNNNSVAQPNSVQNLFLKGAWELLVKKGDVNSFQVLLNLTQGKSFEYICY